MGCDYGWEVQSRGLGGDKRRFAQADGREDWMAEGENGTAGMCGTEFGNGIEECKCEDVKQACCGILWG